MNDRLKSFADLPRDQIKTVKPEWKDWGPIDAMRLSSNMINDATQALRTWLDARLEDLHRERVSLDDIQVSHRGGRTLILVNGVSRFEFKLKFTMEKS